MKLKPSKLYNIDGYRGLNIKNDLIKKLGRKGKDKLVIFPLDLIPIKDKYRITFALRPCFPVESKYRWARKVSLNENKSKSKKYSSYFIRIPKLIEKNMLWKDGQKCVARFNESQKWINIINKNPVKIPEELKLELELFINRFVPGGRPGLYKDKELSKPAPAEEIYMHILKEDVKGKRCERGYKLLLLKYLDIIKKSLKENTDEPSLFHEEIIRLRKAPIEELSLIVDLLPELPKYNISVKMFLEEFPEYLKGFDRYKFLRAKVLGEIATKSERKEYKTLLKKLQKTLIWKLLQKKSEKALLNG